MNEVGEQKNLTAEWMSSKGTEKRTGISLVPWDFVHRVIGLDSTNKGRPVDNNCLLLHKAAHFNQSGIKKEKLVKNELQEQVSH